MALKKAEHDALYRKSKNYKKVKKQASYKYRRSEKGKAVQKAARAKYRAAKLKAIPKWANLEVIKTFYENCPKGHHVDHIYPLQGELCCGLHVIENLQYLTASENLSKRNKIIHTSVEPKE